MMFGIRDYAIAGLSIAIVVLWGWTSIEIGSLEDEVRILELEATELNMNITSLKGGIDTQNSKIEKMKADREENLAELEIWKSKPAEIRYNTIYKKIPEYIDMRVENCEQTKTIIDAARSINFNELD